MGENASEPGETTGESAVPLTPRSRAGAVLRSAGAVVAGAARGAAQGAAAAWNAIDPDVRRQAAELPLVGLTMLASRRPPPEPLPDDGHRPVVFVHGLGGHRGNFLPARLFFRLHGRSRTYAAGFPPGDVESQARELRDFVDAVLRVNSLPADAQVDLVAHSMGGIVARLALEDGRTRARVATLATLATPHAGTHVARYAATGATLALRPDSPLLQRLSAQIPWRAPPRLVCFWSRSDVMLLPAQTACAAGAECVELPSLTHYGFLLQPACFRAVLAALG